MAEQNQSVSVFNYLNAREFLERVYNFEKDRNPVFSHRYIAKEMNAKSSSFFKDVLSGRILLSPARVRMFSRLFKLNKRESEYFENMVLYNQAESEGEKEHYLKKLSAPSTRHVLVEAFQMEYFGKWFYAAVREVLAIQDFQGDYEELAKMLEPPITTTEAMNAIQLLIKLKLIRKNSQGGFERVDTVVTSGTDGNAEMIKPAIRENLELSRRALDQFPPKARPFSYLTLSVSEASFLKIRDRLRSLRKELLEIAVQDEAVDRLYQLNFQLFPVSKIVKRRKK